MDEKDHLKMSLDCANRCASVLMDDLKSLAAEFRKYRRRAADHIAALEGGPHKWLGESPDYGLIRYAPILSRERAVMCDSVSGEFVRLDEVAAMIEAREARDTSADVLSVGGCRHSDYDKGLSVEDGACPLCLMSDLHEALADQ